MDRAAVFLHLAVCEADCYRSADEIRRIRLRLDAEVITDADAAELAAAQARLARNRIDDARLLLPEPDPAGLAIPLPGPAEVAFVLRPGLRGVAARWLFALASALGATRR